MRRDGALGSRTVGASSPPIAPPSRTPRARQAYPGERQTRPSHTIIGRPSPHRTCAAPAWRCPSRSVARRSASRTRRGSEGQGVVLAVYSICTEMLALSHVDCQEITPGGVSGVGGRRGINRGWLPLFRPPLPEPCVQLSPHTALRLARSHASRRSASRLPPRPPAAYLVPFALCAAFPRALVGRDADDYYGIAVALGLAPGRPSRLPSAIDMRARRRCPVRPLQWTHCPPSARRRVRGPAVSTHYPSGPASDALRGMCACITGDWGSSNPAFTVSRGSRGSQSYAPSDRSRFPTMLLSPLAFAARSGGRPRSRTPPNFSPLRGGSMTG
jgi:hypothetical protein